MTQLTDQALPTLFKRTLTDVRWMSLIGPDARDFLQRVTTVDAKNLALGFGAPGFFLNPQGKIRAAFTLWHYAPESYAFEYAVGHRPEESWHEKELLAAIDQFTFGENMQLAPVPQLKAVQFLSEKADDLLDWAGPEFSGMKLYETRAALPPNTGDMNGIRVCLHDAGMTVWGLELPLHAWIKAADPEVEIREISEVEWRGMRILTLRPEVDHEITADLKTAAGPLDLGLRSAIADQKGCYPGQEVIEKIISLGAPPFRLVQIHGKGPAPREGSEVLSAAQDPVKVGTLTSVAPLPGDEYVGLAIVRKIQAKEGLEIRFAPTSENTGTQANIVRVSSYEVPSDSPAS